MLIHTYLFLTYYSFLLISYPDPKGSHSPGSHCQFVLANTKMLFIYVGFRAVVQNTGEVKQRLQDTEIPGVGLSISDRGFGDYRLLATSLESNHWNFPFLCLGKVTDSASSGSEVTRTCRRDGWDVPDHR